MNQKHTSRREVGWWTVLILISTAVAALLVAWYTEMPRGWAAILLGVLLATALACTGAIYLIAHNCFLCKHGM